MQGVITKYFEEKGYGFITGENGENYFFHISQVENKSDLMNDVYAFLCPSLTEENCRAVEFVPEPGNKGIEARKLYLTDLLVNNMNSREIFDVEITDVSYSRETLTRTVSGIKKGSVPPPFSTAGGNGTFRLGYPEVYRFLVLSFRRKDQIGWGKLECHKEVLQVNERRNMTESFVNNLRSKLVGTTLSIFSDGDNWRVKDSSALII